MENFTPRQELLGNRNIGKRIDKHVKAEKHLEAMNELFDHMEGISDNPSGSKPEDYLRDEDVEALKHFKELADAAHWPNANMYGLRYSRRIPRKISGMPDWAISGAPAWTSSDKTAKSGLTKVLFFPKKGGEQRGYQFARLGIDPTQPVAFCEDGKLYSQRGPELQKSKGIGWGSLPDPEPLLKVLSVGRAAVDYGYRGTLFEKLASNIPEKILLELIGNPKKNS